MKFGLLLLCVSLAGCSPVATMADTDTDTDTDTDPAPTQGATVSASSATTSMSSSNGSSPTTAPPPTATESTQGSTADPPDTAEETSACAPGTVDCPCDVGSICDEGLLCIDGTCVAEIPCDEPEAEPNNTIDASIDLGPIACSQDFEMTDGALAGLDMDVYGFTEGPAPVVPCFNPDPVLRTDADEDVRVCVYLDCGDEDGTVNCSGVGMGTQEEDTFEDLPGCCDSGSARFFSHSCTGFGGDAPTFYARVISSDEEACVPYTLNLRFD